jgi:hypothetical protein
MQLHPSHLGDLPCPPAASSLRRSRASREAVSVMVLPLRALFRGTVRDNG